MKSAQKQAQKQAIEGETQIAERAPGLPSNGRYTEVRHLVPKKATTKKSTAVQRLSDRKCTV